MRIAIVCQEYPPARIHGGIGTQSEIKARRLAGRGHHVRVVAAGGDTATRERVDGVEVHRLAMPDGRLALHTDAARWLAWSLEVAAGLERLQAEQPIDLVEFAEYGAEGYAYLLNRAPWARVPVAVQLHGPLAMLARTIGWPEPGSDLHAVGLHMEGTCLRLADRVYSSSACSARWAGEAYGLDPKAIPVLHAGVETELFRPPEQPPDGPPTVLFAGRVTPNKGVEELLDACLELAPEVPGLRLRMLGRGEPWVSQRLAARAAQANRPELLDLAGFIGREALPAELQRAWVFALPSIYEGGPGFACLEAMACGVPAIACLGSGAEEAVRDGESGLLVRPGDRPHLVASLRRLLADRELRQRMGRAARQQVEREASAGEAVRSIEALYAEVIERAGREARP